MKNREDELDRAKRIAQQLEHLEQLKATQDREVASLMSTVSAWELDRAMAAHRAPEDVKNDQQSIPLLRG